jgi:hypothetical protein
MGPGKIGVAAIVAATRPRAAEAPALSVDVGASTVHSEITPASEKATLDHRAMPMVDHIRELRERDVTTYLSIGHKLGAAVDPELVELLGRDLFESNTWITGDAFHDALHRSEVLAADAWGAEQSFYLVDGSSSGNHAFSWEPCDRGTRSLFHAISTGRCSSR